MWVYRQSTGDLTSSGQLVGQGYSGCGTGKNDPASQKIKDVGPIPVGFYDIGPLIHWTAVHGPDVLPLTPKQSNAMFGRAGFLIHGDSIVHPGSASKGCIILSHEIRLSMSVSAERILQVIV